MCSCPCHQGDTARVGHSWPNCRCIGLLSKQEPIEPIDTRWELS
jgi:hypothetical protein